MRQLKLEEFLELCQAVWEIMSMKKMKWWKKSPKKDPNEWEKKFQAMQSDYNYLKTHTTSRIEEAKELVREEYKNTIYSLEKEIVHWKEKALNFKKYHQ